MPVYILACFGVYGGLQGWNWSKIGQKIANFAPKSRKSNQMPLYWYWDIPNGYNWLKMIETDMPVYVMTCFVVYGGLQGWNLVKNKQKIADFAPKSQNPIWCLYIGVETYPMTIIH